MRSKTRMRRWLFAAAASLALVCLSSVLPAQVTVPDGAFASVAELNDVLQRGSELERSHRWGDALTHYEDALRDHPGDRALKERLDRSRLHYDVTRRYADSSFNKSLRMTQREALDLYSDLLLKIQAHYVHNPNWNQLVRHGAASLDAALNETCFLQTHVPGAGADRIAGFRKVIRRELDGAVIGSRHQARDVVDRLSRQAANQLRLPAQAAILEFACGAVSALDPYSAFLTSHQLDDVFSQIEGNFVGLGIEIKAENDELLIVSVIPGGPAAQAGMRDGDRIIAVDGKSTREVSTDVAADMLKGEEGSYVNVQIIDRQDRTRLLRVQRRRVEVPSIEDVKIVDPQRGVGYLRLTSFQKTTSRDVDKALWDLHRQGMRSLILDVRGNPGGLLTAAVDVADKFVTTGTIVSTRGRSSQEDYDYKAHTIGTWRVPLIVLIDGDSASASEIFAGAIRDHRRGTVVGQRSYGKGSVQGIFPMNRYDVGLRLTTAKFYSPSGQPISHRGVSPNVVVRQAAKPVGGIQVGEPEQDAALHAALQVARQQLSRRSN